MFKMHMVFEIFDLFIASFFVLEVAFVRKLKSCERRLGFIWMLFFI